MLAGYTVCLFAHTAQGEAALHELVGAGVLHAGLHVIGDLGAPAGEAGAEHHVTFDALHVPAGERALFMDTIRGGGVVLAASDGADGADRVENVAVRHHALKVLRTSAAAANPSHNAAE